MFDLSFAIQLPTVSSPLRSSITYVHGKVFLNFLITKTSSDKFGV